MAGLFAELMTGVLGYDGYVAQGGDWGGPFRAGSVTSTPRLAVPSTSTS